MFDEVTYRGGEEDACRVMRGRVPDLDLVPCLPADVSCRGPLWFFLSFIY
jgi:hypothetical protein